MSALMTLSFLDFEKTEMGCGCCGSGIIDICDSNLKIVIRS